MVNIQPRPDAQRRRPSRRGYSDDDITGRLPVARFATPDDIARVILVLADPSQSGFVNGQALAIHRGGAPTEAGKGCVRAGVDPGPFNRNLPLCSTSFSSARVRCLWRPNAALFLLKIWFEVSCVGALRGATPRQCRLSEVICAQADSDV